MKGSKISILSFSVLLLTACSSEQAISSQAVTTKSAPSSLVFYGEVKAHTKEEILLDFPAKVIALHVEDGQKVQKGTPLVSLDIEDYKLQIATKEKELEINEVNLKQLLGNDNAQYAGLSAIKDQLKLKEGYIKEGTDPDLLSLKNMLPSLEKEVALAKQLYETNLSLFDAHSLASHELEISKQTYEAKLQELENTKLAMNKIKSTLELEVATLNSQLKSTQILSSNTDIEKRTRIEMLELKIEADKLVLDNMKQKLKQDYLKGSDVVAPNDHLIVYDIQCSKGSYITGTEGFSPTPLLKTMSQDSLYILADIPEESLSNIQVGADVTIILADDHEKLPTLFGIVAQISERAVVKDGDTVVEATIEVQDGLDYLKPGLSVDVTLTP
ncbi:hypothetical protein CS063_09600 [Sporanaerobium hydrogeniformans]|uniref:Uncharacterized protein n=1 Tax=Sporanaerobium hydrogeniformans TaxID=3072179 RepID=A0AC61DBZ0_9FIRM|nr:biotin/lipoyl-binding protein [Sporanaerobium hydrogeniformans]PHV70548.1 hypothetical protein CS063_09600 [Sporanaerobium hydrogeniformans]